jgi:hypothetical protein
MRICQPRWSPDGKQIVVAVATAKPANGFKVDNIQPAFVDATGGEPTLVPVDGAAPDLRPTP